MNAQQLAAALRITPEWMSKIANGRAAGSDDIRLRLHEFLRSRGIEPSSLEDESSLSVGSIIHEDPSPPPGMAPAFDLTKEARSDFEALLAKADGNVAKLGWIVQETKHLLVRATHWRSTGEPLSPRERAQEMRDRAAKLPAGRERKILIQAAALLDQDEDEQESMRPIREKTSSGASA